MVLKEHLNQVKSKSAFIHQTAPDHDRRVLRCAGQLPAAVNEELLRWPFYLSVWQSWICLFHQQVWEVQQHLDWVRFLWKRCLDGSNPECFRQLLTSMLCPTTSFVSGSIKSGQSIRQHSIQLSREEDCDGLRTPEKWDVKRQVQHRENQIPHWPWQPNLPNTLRHQCDFQAEFHLVLSV